MARRSVLQKLLSVDMASAVFDHGNHEVGGLVVGAGDVAGLRRPAELLQAYGFEDDPPFVDVVRFVTPVCCSLTSPRDSGERPWPTYPTGFLRPVAGCIVPVWEMSRSRWSTPAEYWRIHRDGSQEMLSVYRGAALGWAGAREWYRPSRLVGPRARWQDGDFLADVTGDWVDLTALEEPASGGWVQQRPATWGKRVALSECEVYEVVYTATWRGAPVRVLDTGSGSARLELQGPSLEQVRSLGAVMVDQGVFEVRRVPVGELSDLVGVSRELVQPAEEVP